MLSCSPVLTTNGVSQLFILIFRFLTCYFAGASTTQVLYLYGTIPIFYSGAQYNIPVTIWLTEMYPFQNPVPYVSPTPGS